MYYFLLRTEPNVEGNVDIYKKIVDTVISAYIPAETDDPLMFELAQIYQIHSNFKSCKKYKYESCRFNFGKLFTSETIIVQSIKNASEFDQFLNLEKWNSILSKVSKYSNEYLDQSKKLCQASTIKHVLNKLQILEENYYWALSISTDSLYQI